MLNLIINQDRQSLHRIVRLFCQALHPHSHFNFHLLNTMITIYLVSEEQHPRLSIQMIPLTYRALDYTKYASTLHTWLVQNTLTPYYLPSDLTIDETITAFNALHSVSQAISTQKNTPILHLILFNILKTPLQKACWLPTFLKNLSHANRRKSFLNTLNHIIASMPPARQLDCLTSLLTHLFRFEIKGQGNHLKKVYSFFAFYHRDLPNPIKRQLFHLSEQTAKRIADSEECSLQHFCTIQDQSINDPIPTTSKNPFMWLCTPQKPTSHRLSSFYKQQSTASLSAFFSTLHHASIQKKTEYIHAFDEAEPHMEPHATQYVQTFHTLKQHRDYLKQILDARPHPPM